MVSSQSTAPGPSNIRLTLSNYIADILLDSRTTGESIYHWIVQRVGSPEILQWRQEFSLEAATAEAQRCLEQLVERDNKTRQ
jgi:hypothetical protein